ncbi:MAG: hypothetical protein PHU80_00215, partial [Kiritimatiellae bacterium]|nr:hypothetical protein [Kiritimatiellia bacterium]
GYPRAGDGRSSYCVYDSASSAVTFRQLPFDSAGLRQALLNTGMHDDLWLRQKELLQKLPTLREKVCFAKVAPGTGPQSQPAVEAKRQNPPLPKKNSRITAAMLGTASLLGLLATAWIMAYGKKNAFANQAPALIVPEFDLPAIAAYPLVPPDKNLLPPLPLSPAPPERFENWRYALDNLSRQTFQTGLRSGASTLVVHHHENHKFSLESPLIRLDGVALKALRLRGLLRKHEDFKGSVFYQVITYTRDNEGEPRQHRVEPYEMRTSRRRLSPPGAERDVRIKIPKVASHARFRIEANFEGTLEIEQPYLTGDVKAE